MLRDLRDDRFDPAALAPILSAAPDVLLLTDIDYDAGLVTLAALAERLAAEGLSYPHLLAQRPNTGWTTGRDLDGDGRRGGPRDAQGFGWFAGQGGQAVLSRHPLRLVADHSGRLWRDVPGSLMTAEDPGADLQRLASSAFWQVQVTGPLTVDLLTLAATPPLFDGPEDRNGRRNADEVRFWGHVLEGAFGPPPAGPVVWLGNANLDPQTGDGLRAAMAEVLAHPRWQDPLPQEPSVTWDSTGPMRVSYVLPDHRLCVLGAGVTPSAEGAGPHRLVWVDLAVP